MVTGEDDLILEANDEFLRTIGRARPDLDGGLRWPAITPPDQLERDGAGLEQVRRHGSATVVKDFVTPDGTRVPALVCISAVSWRPYRWVGVVVDLSRQEQLRRLAVSEAAIVSTLLEDAPIGFAFFDPDLRFVRINREMAAMNGRNVAEHEGRYAFDIVPDVRESAEMLMRGVLETGQALRDVEIVGFTAADPGVEHTWLESFFPIRAPQGPVVGLAAIARDVTETVRLQRELAEASRRRGQALRDLQASLLTDLPAVPGVELASRYLGADEEVGLGGDWYDVLLGPDGRLLLFVGDVVGHGVDAVGLMARASGALRAYIWQGCGPAEALTRLNALFHASGEDAMATASIATLDSGTGCLRYAGAGHPFPVLWAPDAAPRLLDEAQGVMLGSSRNATYREAAETLADGGGLLLYTDGLVERRDEALDLGLARLTDALRAGPGSPCAAEALDRAMAACLAGRPRHDDVCLLAAHRLPG